MNVCLLTETFHPVTGGGETQARVLGSGLAAGGVGVQLITRRFPADLPRRDSLGDVRLYRLSPGGAGQLKKWGLVATAFITLLRLRRNYDAIVVCGYRILGIPAVMVSRMTGTPCVLKADSLGEMSGEFFGPGLRRFGLRRTNWLFRGLLRLRNRLLRQATGFVAISSAVAEELTGCGVDYTQIIRIPNSVDTDLFSPADASAKAALREKLGIPKDGRVAVYTGRLVTSKGLPMLLRVWRSVVTRHAGAHLLLVGEGGLGIQNCEEQLRHYVSKHSLDGQVTFAGSVENVHEYLQASDFFVFPTEREAFGISTIEAMSCALPVIATNVEGLSDIVSANETAIVVPSGDATSLEAAIERVLQNDASVRRIAHAGRALAIERFSEPRVLQQYRELLSGLAREPGRAEAKN